MLHTTVREMGIAWVLGQVKQSAVRLISEAEVSPEYKHSVGLELCEFIRLMDEAQGVAGALDLVLSGRFEGFEGGEDC